MSKMKKAICHHCGNETLMKVIDSYKKEFGDILGDDYGYDLQVVLFCPICSEYNLVSAYWDYTYGEKSDIDEYDIYEGKAAEETYLYPVASNVIYQKQNMIPHDVLNNFKKAIKLKNQDEESCLIKLRKTIEMICNDKKAEGDSLYPKLSYLFASGLLPKTLKSASTLTRKLGNIGAHESDIEIDSTELKIVIELVEYIIQYIYVLPKEIEKIENKFNLTESSKEKTSS